MGGASKVEHGVRLGPGRRSSNLGKFRRDRSLMMGPELRPNCDNIKGGESWPISETFNKAKFSGDYGKVGRGPKPSGFWSTKADSKRKTD